MAIHRSRMMFGMVMLFGMLLFPASAAHAQATPHATPAASPVADLNDCDGLAPYFQELAGLTLVNDGLVLMRSVRFDVLALTDVQAATVVASLTELIPQVVAIAAPEPAAAYHAAYLDMLEWYRAMAANRDQASHQQLINNDRQLFSAMGQAVQIGQSACGFDVWNEAREAAFPPDD